jgi:5-methyltetrahydrofolate--homocysteine methyltransferase
MGTRFLDALHSGRVLLMDGAMGTELQRAGMPAGACYEEWNLSHPERVRAIHRAYAEAGAEVLLTNTFQANPPALARHHLAHKIGPMCQASIALAKQAVGPRGFVLGDMTTFALAKNEGVRSDFLRGWTGADALLVETCVDLIDGLSVPAGLTKLMTSPGRYQFALLLSFTFHRDATGRLETDDRFSPQYVAEHVNGFAFLAALGVNCGRDISVEDCAEILRCYRSVTDLPLFARPNAGTPTQVDGRWVYPHTPEAMAAKLPLLLEAGAAMVGGCCGTTPEHIAAFRRVVDAWNERN